MSSRWSRLLQAGALLAGLGSVLAVEDARARPRHGHMGGHGHMQDMQGIHALFANRADIRRTVREVRGGVETLTESDVPAVADLIREHVAAMYQRLKDGRPIHARDPLFAELFRNAVKIDMKIERTAKGVKVVETSIDPDVVKLIRRHAEVVSAFLANGHREMMRNHEVPRPAP